MRRSFAAIVLFALMSAACSSSTDAITDPEGTAEALQDCGISGLLELFATFELVGDIVDIVTGEEEPNPDITVTPTGTANEFNFTGSFDTNLDQVNDTTLSGTALFSSDPSGGFGLGDSVDITATQTGLTAATYNLNATATLTGISLTGTANFPNTGGCAINITIPVGTPLNILPGDLEFQLAGLNLGNFIEFQVSGGFMISVTRDGITLTADVDLPGSNSVDFTNVELNGVGLDDTFLTLPPTDDLITASQCMASSFFTMVELAQALGNLSAAIGSGAPTVNGNDYTATPVTNQVNTFDVTIDFEGQIFTGQVVFPSDPTAGAVTGLVTVPTWSLTVAVPAGRFGPFGATGTATLGVELVGNSAMSVYGSAGFTDGDCVVTIGISPNAPYAFMNNENSFTFTSEYRDAMIQADAILINDPFEVGFINAVVNGLPVPAALLGELAEFLD